MRVRAMLGAVGWRWQEAWQKLAPPFQVPSPEDREWLALGQVDCQPS